MSRDAVSVVPSADIAKGKAKAEYPLHMKETLCNELKCLSECLSLNLFVFELAV